MTLFSEIIGHESIKKHLMDLLAHQTLPHSLLFYGEAGLGKLDMAFALASEIVGRPVFSLPKGEQYLQDVAKAREINGESVKKIESEGLPIYIDKQEAFWLRPIKSSLSIEQWHLLLSDYLDRKSDTPRVIIIEDFHTANKIMENAMLKTIEEPPANVYFIIITNKRETVIDTIVSRCMLVPFQGVDRETIKSYLLSKGVLDDEQLNMALSAGHGNPTLVKKFLTEGDIPQLQKAMVLMQTIAKKKNFFTLASLEVEKVNSNEMIEILQWMRVLGRDMLALRYGAPQDLLQCPTYKEKLIKLLPFWSSKALHTLAKETLKGEEALRLHVKVSLVIDGILIALRRVVKEKLID